MPRQAQCQREGSGTAGTDEEGQESVTGSVCRGKRRAPLSGPRKAAGTRLGRGAVARPVGLRTGRWPAAGLAGWLRQVALPREGEEAGGTPSPAGIPPRRQRCSVPAQPGSSAGREGTRGECEPPSHALSPAPLPIPTPLLRWAPAKSYPICGSPPGINPGLALNLPNSAYFSKVRKAARSDLIAVGSWLLSPFLLLVLLLAAGVSSWEVHPEFGVTHLAGG